MDNGLVMINRGYRMEVGTAPGQAFDSIFSGNTVEICPVGALTSVKYRFKARPWELKRIPSVCNNCSVGCNVRIDVRVDKIMRQMSRCNDAIDDGWLCDRGRWDFDYVNDTQRLRTPLVRRQPGGPLEPAGWGEALGLIAERLRAIKERYGPKAIGGIGSTRTTNEEAYLFQRLLREVLETPNVDHHHGFFPGPRDPLTGRPWMLTTAIADFERASHIVLVASDPYERQPILNLRIKKALKAGARIYIVNEGPTELDRLATRVIRLPQHGAGAAAHLMLEAALGLENLRNPRQEVQARLQGREQERQRAEALCGAQVTEALRELAREIALAPAALILYDEMATLAPGCANLAADLQALAVITGNIDRPGAGVGPLFEDANSLGARDMGLLPDSLPGYRPASPAGLSYQEMLTGEAVKALYVMGANPARHLPDGDLRRGKEFIVVQEILLTETAQQADVVLPALTYAEKDGSMTNVDHHVQAIRRALRPLPGARADWEILMDLAALLGHPWSYEGPEDVLREIAAHHPLYQGLTWEGLGLQGVRTGEVEVAHV
jgi:predicted molibdopterin-dependent oxidoreductase YjgC